MMTILIQLVVPTASKISSNDFTENWFTSLLNSVPSLDFSSYCFFSLILVEIKCECFNFRRIWFKMINVSEKSGTFFSRKRIFLNKQLIHSQQVTTTNFGNKCFNELKNIIKYKNKHTMFVWWISMLGRPRTANNID